MPIFNNARFRQHANYDSITLWGSDTDMRVDLDQKGYLEVEWKVKGTPLPKGQEITLKTICNDMGTIKPTFIVIAHHQTHPEEDITGTNSFVKEVWFNAPWLRTWQKYKFRGRASLNFVLFYISMFMNVRRCIRKGGWDVDFLHDVDSEGMEFVEWWPMKALEADSYGNEFEKDFCLRFHRQPEWEDYPDAQVILDNMDTFFQFCDELEEAAENSWGEFSPEVRELVFRCGFKGSPQEFYDIHFGHWCQYFDKQKLSD